MNALALANEFPIFTFLLAAMKQARIPGSRHREGTAVCQFHHQGVFNFSRIQNFHDPNYTAVPPQHIATGKNYLVGSKMAILLALKI